MRRDLLYLLLIVSAFWGGFFTGRQQGPSGGEEHRSGKVETAIENTRVPNRDVRHPGSQKTVYGKSNSNSSPVHDESIELLIPPREKLTEEKSKTDRPVLHADLFKLKESFKASLASSGIPEDQLHDMAEAFAASHLSHLRARQSMSAPSEPEASFPTELQKEFQASLREAGVPEKEIEMMSIGAFRPKRNVPPFPESDGPPFPPGD